MTGEENMSYEELHTALDRAIMLKKSAEAQAESLIRQRDNYRRALEWTMANFADLLWVVDPPNDEEAKLSFYDTLDIIAATVPPEKVTE